MDDDELDSIHSLMAEECNSSANWSSALMLDYPPLSCNFNHTILAQMLANLSLRLYPMINYPEYYSFQYRVIGTLFQSVIFVVGVLGNVLVVLVVYRSPKMRSTTNCYLVSLAIADCLVLVAAVPNEIVSYYLVGDEWIWGRVGCALLIFTQYAGINSSSLCITALTFERYIAFCHPLRAHSMCTVRRAKRIIGGIWAFSLCYCSPWLLLTKTEPLIYEGLPKKEKCTFALSRNSYVGYYFADLIMFYVIPLLLSCVWFAFIARALLSPSFIDNTRAQPTRIYRPTIKRNATDAGGEGGGRGRGVYAVEANLQSRSQGVKMLAAVVALFAAFWSPYRVWLVYNSFANEPYMELWFLMFAKTMIFINNAVNPILYNAMSKKFRHAFRQMLLCGKGSLPRNYSTTMRLSSTATWNTCASSRRHAYP